MVTHPTRLGRIAGAPIAAPEASQTRLGLAIAAGPLSSEQVVLPRLGSAWIVLASHAAVQRIEGETTAALEGMGIQLSAMTALTYEAERAVRTLAEAVRDPDTRAVHFGTLAEWQGLDSDIIATAWHVYCDVRERLDPLAEPLTAAERGTIEAAIAKKNSMLLRSFGVSRLATYLATTDAPPST